MPETPTPLDLDALRADIEGNYGYCTVVLTVRGARALIAEVDRLRAEVARLEEDLSDRTMDLAEATRPDRPAPAWDEGAMTEAAARVIARRWGMSVRNRDVIDDARAIVAVVREHLPVKPDREAVIDALWGTSKNLPIPHIDREEVVTAQADAVLDLWPGRSEAEVKAEALREWVEDMTGDLAATKAEGIDLGRDYLRGMRSALMQATERADRLAAEGGGDRG